ncbi:serine/threonine protein kinase [Streptomyces sp. SKN60]|nr:serine/threonine protein kinase [Streptomyces sp. SKN60]
MGGPRLEPLRGDDPRELGAYRLLGRLGSGGMGRVYLGRTVSGRLVAVKTLLADGVPEDADRRRFAREVALARRVTGVFTVSVMDADAQAPKPWMATEYVPAPSLAELVRDAGPLPAPAVRWIAAGLAEALADLHRTGVVHRDVKPGNVLLPLSGPRLIDFGISHALDLTRTTLTLGTIAFTSPEQARGESSTAASDLYATGATLLHLATGRSPYGDVSDAFQLLARVQQAEADLTGLAPELSALIRPLLARDPAARPTPDALLAAFAEDPPGGGEMLPEAWTTAIRAHQDFVPPRPVDTGTVLDAPSPPPLEAAPTRTAPPRRPAPEPVPEPESQPVEPAVEPAVLPGRAWWRRRGAVAGTVALVVALTAGYVTYQQGWYDTGGGGDQPVATGTCLSNLRTSPGTYQPETPVAVACYSSESLAVVTGPWADGKCPDYGEPSEGSATLGVCVAPHVLARDCLSISAGDSGSLPEDALWQEESCEPGKRQLKVVYAVESSGGEDGSTFEDDCGTMSEPWPHLATRRADYCFDPSWPSPPS